MNEKYIGIAEFRATLHRILDTVQPHNPYLKKRKSDVPVWILTKRKQNYGVILSMERYEVLLKTEELLKCKGGRTAYADE